MASSKSVARLNIRLSPEIKATIEEAAAQMGQTVSDFATASLLQAARTAIHEQNVTRLTARDRERFAELLEDESRKPNAALVRAARRYKQQSR